jgi:hypothetical protein
LALPSADRDGGLAATVAGSPSWNVFFDDLLGGRLERSRPLAVLDRDEALASNKKRGLSQRRLT